MDPAFAVSPKQVQAAEHRTHACALHAGCLACANISIAARLLVFTACITIPPAAGQVVGSTRFPPFDGAARLVQVAAQDTGVVSATRVEAILVYQSSGLRRRASAHTRTRTKTAPLTARSAELTDSEAFFKRWITHTVCACRHQMNNTVIQLYAVSGGASDAAEQH